MPKKRSAHRTSRRVCKCQCLFSCRVAQVGLSWDARGGLTGQLSRGEIPSARTKLSVSTGNGRRRRAAVLCDGEN